ncbi:branched-chain amino acid aminotransferase [Aciduricibacillus chroicocephali]|uniref:Branched-chain-amino-acid aminotransferase n=1 Tax=Aciduricibacillus chroicocephali TaxID=3054939 RepID=A0ABY9KTN6_9BACI|nr:branched-chain amino acid aminotransferase [Bacillaceae bacterium 44XB]
MSNQEIKVTLSTSKKEKPKSDQLPFGKYFSDHMFIMDYKPELGWYDPRIVPYGPIELDPAASILHYGQTIFEGMKAYVDKDGGARIFRPEMNVKRLNRSNDRMCIPQVDEDIVLEAVKKIVSIDQDWIPNAPGTALYIRPYVFATEANINVVPSKEYKLMIILSPVGAYFKEGLNPVKIAVEDKYVRAVPGGTGEAKTGGNYAGSFRVQENVAKKGFSQVLWLDGAEHKYIEEVGASNVFFKISGEVVTPALTGSILHGVTRDSVIKLLKHWGVPVTERRISIEELYAASLEGQLEEAFSSGTAAVISPIGQLTWKDKDLVINDNKIGELTQKVYDTLTGIQYGTEEDVFNWVTEIK